MNVVMTSSNKRQLFSFLLGDRDLKSKVVLKAFMGDAEDLVLGSAAASSLGNAAARQVNETIEEYGAGDAVDRDWKWFQFSPAIGPRMIQFDLFKDSMFGFIVSLPTENVKATFDRDTIYSTANGRHGRFG